MLKEKKARNPGMDVGPGVIYREFKLPIAATMPVAVVESQGLAGFQGSVATIRLTQEALAHLKALSLEAEWFRTAVAAETECPEAARPDKLAALAELLNDLADAAQEHSVVRPLTVAVDTRARKAVPPVQGTVSETCLRWMFEEHCLCLGTQSPSF